MDCCTVWGQRVTESLFFLKKEVRQVGTVASNRSFTWIWPGPCRVETPFSVKSNSPKWWKDQECLPLTSSHRCTFLNLVFGPPTHSVISLTCLSRKSSNVRNFHQSEAHQQKRCFCRAGKSRHKWDLVRSVKLALLPFKAPMKQLAELYWTLLFKVFPVKQGSQGRTAYTHFTASFNKWFQELMMNLNILTLLLNLKKFLSIFQRQMLDYHWVLLCVFFKHK